MKDTKSVNYVDRSAWKRLDGGEGNVVRYGITYLILTHWPSLMPLALLGNRADVSGWEGESDQE